MKKSNVTHFSIRSAFFVVAFAHRINISSFSVRGPYLIQRREKRNDLFLLSVMFHKVKVVFCQNCCQVSLQSLKCGGIA